MEDVVSWIGDVFDSLNDNSGAVQAVATVALVAVTAVYVCLTRKMAREMERARQASLRPVLLIERKEAKGRDKIRNAVAAKRGDFDDSLPCDLCNAGPGPALNVRLNIKGLDSDFERGLIHLASGSRIEEYLRLERDPDLRKGQEETRVIRVEYEDVYGNRFSSLLKVQPDRGSGRWQYELTLLGHGRGRVETRHHMGQKQEPDLRRGEEIQQ